MSAGNNTKLTPSEVSAMAGRHRTVADDISNQQRDLNNNITNLTSVNQGAMMRRLVEVHQEWNTHTTKIVTELTDMAQTLDGVAQELQSQDQNNTSGITT